jgi:hypothetical protein
VAAGSKKLPEPANDLLLLIRRIVLNHCNGSDKIERVVPKVLDRRVYESNDGNLRAVSLE